MKKALIIRFSSIGDIILTSPAIRSLKACFPEKKIDFLVKEEFLEIIKENPNIDNVISLKKGESLFSLRKKIKGKYDVILDLHGNIRSKLLCSSLFGVKVFRTKRYDFLRHISSFVKDYALLRKLPSVPQRHINALLSIDGKNDNKGLDLFLEEKYIKLREYILSKNNFKENEYIILAPGAKWLTKRWSVEKFREVVKFIDDKNFIIIGGKEDIDKGKLISKGLEKRVLNYCGEIQLNSSAALIEKASMVLSNDSSATHIAAAFKIPVVCIFASTVPELGFAPYKTNSRIINSSMECRPCTTTGRDKCPKFDTPKCLDEISSEEVIRNMYLISKTYENYNN